MTKTEQYIEKLKEYIALVNAYTDALELINTKGLRDEIATLEAEMSEQKPVKDCEYFVKVYIKSKDDLPKEDNEFIVHLPTFESVVCVNKEAFSKCKHSIDWYLLPVDAMPKTEFKPVKSAREILTEKMEHYFATKTDDNIHAAILLNNLSRSLQWTYIIEAMEEFASQTDLREELIKFAQQFYSDEETCRHNVDEYLKTKQ